VRDWQEKIREFATVLSKYSWQTVII